MKHLIIYACVVLIASAGAGLSGCQGGQIQDFGGADTTAATESSAEVSETSSSTFTSADGGACDPIVITNTVIEVAGGGEELPTEPEGQTCLMSRVPDDVSFVFSVDRNAQQIVSAMVDNIPQGNDEKAAMLQKFMMPFDQLDLEEVVGFAKFKYVDGIMDEPNDDCRECVKMACPSCLGEAEALCTSFQPAPDDIEKCAWEQATADVPIADCANNCVGQCAEKCTEEKPEPESFGFLVRWLPIDSDPNGTQKFADLKDFVDSINKDNLDSEIKRWHERCDADPRACDNSGDSLPSELKADKKMEIELIDSTVALVHSAAVRPNVIDPVRICKYIRFDSIKERPAVYGELKDLKLIMKIKPGEALTAATRDSRKIVAGVDLKDQFYRLYAGVVDKGSLATGAYLSSVINLGDNFGLELWKQMMMGLVSKK
jgi:hypothetical protein